MPVTALVPLATRLRLARLAVVVPPESVGPEAADFAAHGADLLVLTKGDRSVDDVVAAVDTVRRRLVGLTTLVAVDDKEVAEKSMADVLFIKRPSWLPFGIEKPHEFALLGRSIDDADDMDKIDGEPFSFAFVGPAVDDDAADPRIEEMAERYNPTELPANPVWFAAGGVSSANVANVLSAGARRVTVSTAIFKAEDPFAETKAIADLVTAAWRADENSAAYGEQAFNEFAPRPSDVRGELRR